jgi:hypothetical protein
MSGLFQPAAAAASALIKAFAAGKNEKSRMITEEEAASFLNGLLGIFSSNEGFREKKAALDSLFSANSPFSGLEEYLFDLLMLHFIAADAGKPDENYLESEEWTKIEDETADRGSEWLNLLIYIGEVKEEKRKPDLQDFLDEFLLVEDELYQDEFFIYEPVILHAPLAEASMEAIVEAGKKIDADELKEIFIPLMAYFNKTKRPEEKCSELGSHDFNAPLNVALLSATYAFEAALG